MNPTSLLKVLIVEDQISTQRRLKNFFKQQPDFTVVGVCSTVREAIELVHTTKPNLLLLDIGLPDGTGFDILEKMTTGQSKVIFLTTHNEYAIKALRYGAIDYLLKPFNEQKLEDALQKVIRAQPLLQEQIAITLQRFRKIEQQGRLVLRSRRYVQIVELKEIMYLQGKNHYTTFFLNGGKKEVTTKLLREYEELLAGSSFLRTHQSYLVNERYISQYHLKDGFLYLKDGTQIPVSFRKKETIANYFNHFWKKLKSLKVPR